MRCIYCRYINLLEKQAGFLGVPRLNYKIFLGAKMAGVATMCLRMATLDKATIKTSLGALVTGATSLSTIGNMSPEVLLVMEKRAPKFPNPKFVESGRENYSHGHR